MRVTPRRTRTAAFVFAISAPAPVFAYMGPDIGVGALEAALGVAASLALMLLFVAWYPLKRLNRRIRARLIMRRAIADPGLPGGRTPNP